jgi:four helix bundle protein
MRRIGIGDRGWGLPQYCKGGREWLLKVIEIFGCGNWAWIWWSRLTQGFPKTEQYGLISQMQRAAVSIPSNIAEGHTREHTKEYFRHLSISQVSLAELETQLEIASRLNYLSNEQFDQTLKHTTSLTKQLYALRNALIRRIEEQR